MPAARAHAALALVFFVAVSACCGTERTAVLDRDVKPPKNEGGAKPAPTGGGRPASNHGRQISPHLALGVPTDADPSDDLQLVKPQYALSYNPKRNGANWVGWNLNASHFGPAPRHQGKFLVDDQLPPGVYRPRHDDYTDSGFDRGHMVRSEERTVSPEENRTTFLMTNILPQTHDLNAGPWLRLEEHCQDLSKRGKDLFIVAGPLYGANPSRIGKGVAVPEAFFKVITVLERGQGAADVSANTRVIAVRMPNVKGIISDDWKRYRTRVDDVEKASGYDLFSDIAEATQAVVEARVDNELERGSGRAAGAARRSAAGRRPAKADERVKQHHPRDAKQAQHQKVSEGHLVKAREVAEQREGHRRDAAHRHCPDPVTGEEPVEALSRAVDDALQKADSPEQVPPDEVRDHTPHQRACRDRRHRRHRRPARRDRGQHVKLRRYRKVQPISQQGAQRQPQRPELFEKGPPQCLELGPEQVGERRDEAEQYEDGDEGLQDEPPPASTAAR